MNGYVILQVAIGDNTILLRRAGIWHLVAVAGVDAVHMERHDHYEYDIVVRAPARFEHRMVVTPR